MRNTRKEDNSIFRRFALTQHSPREGVNYGMRARDSILGQQYEQHAAGQGDRK
jgi:hypothetical protein